MEYTPTVTVYHQTGSVVIFYLLLIHCDEVAWESTLYRDQGHMYSRRYGLQCIVCVSYHTVYYLSPDCHHHLDDNTANTDDVRRYALFFISLIVRSARWLLFCVKAIIL